MNFSAVVSLHTNPTQCGVAKFGAQLAQRLDLPFIGISGPWGAHPLFSLKWSEPNDLQRSALVREIIQHGNCSIFWHDAGDERITEAAQHVFYADPSLGSPGLWCPSLITPRPRSVRLFSFGMAGRLQPEKYRRVRELLDAAGIRYHLRVSVGLHEGTSLDGAEKHFDALKQIMGEDHVTILGILSDEAVSEELANCDYVLAFFEKGLRANNTTVHAALGHRCSVITNHDSSTPEEFADGTYDIAAMPEWPMPHVLWPYTWDNLIEAMRRECEKSKLPAAG